MRTGIIIPTFNEPQNVVTITERICSALAGTDFEYEIWFIDDSRDNTPGVLAGIVADHSNVHFIHRETARGLATAVVEGFHRCTADNLVVMDADLQHPPELLPVILQRLAEGNDIVIPSRFVPGGSDGGLSPVRKFISWTARNLGRLAIKRLRKISDCTGGYFGLHRHVIDDVNLQPIGWKILMEILVNGNYRTIHEIPYVFVDRDTGESKMSVHEQWNYLRHIFRLLWRSPEDRRFYLFCFVGGLGTVVNLVAFSLLHYTVHLDEIAASVIASVIAMAHNFLWNDNLTWKGHAHPVKWKRVMQVPIFAVVSSVSVLLTAGLVKVFVLIHWNLLLGQFLGIVISTLWSYVANSRWTWKVQRSTDGQRSVTHVRVTQEDM